jgi:hypothetical protein
VFGVLAFFLVVERFQRDLVYEVVILVVGDLVMAFDFVDFVLVVVEAVLVLLLSFEDNEDAQIGVGGKFVQLLQDLFEQGAHLEVVLSANREVGEVDPVFTVGRFVVGLQLFN